MADIKKEISKQPIPTKEECLAFYKELTNLADARFVPYYKIAIEALEQESILDKIRAEIAQFADAHCSSDDIKIYDVFQIIDKYKESEE